MIPAAFAQNPVGLGGKQFNVGISPNQIAVVPIYFGLDYGVHEDITVGGEGVLVLNPFVFGARVHANYHFNTLLEIPIEWDFYAGLNLGFYFASGVPIILGGQVGGRYYFNYKFGVNLEFTGGTNIYGAKLGISMKL